MAKLEFLHLRYNFCFLLLFTCIHNYNWSELNIFKNMCKELHTTDNSTVPTPRHFSEEICHSEYFQTDLGKKWDKGILDLPARKRGGKEEEKQKIKSLNENSDDKTIFEKIEILRKRRSEGENMMTKGDK